MERGLDGQVLVPVYVRRNYGYPQEDAFGIIALRDLNPVTPKYKAVVLPSRPLFEVLSKSRMTLDID